MAVVLTLALFALVLTGLWMGTAADPLEADPPSRAANPRRVVSLSEPPAESPDRDDGGSEAQPPDGDPLLAERPTPPTPEVEGLFALADAAGKTVVSCPSDAFPPGADLPPDTVSAGGRLFILREPQPLEAAGRITVAGAAPYELFWAGEVGSLGFCQVKPAEAPEQVDLRLDDEDRERLAAILNQRASTELDDGEEAMFAEQVALDTEGLSEGAKVWLQARIDARFDAAEGTVQEPHAPEDFEGAKLIRAE